MNLSCRCGLTSVLLWLSNPVLSHGDVSVHHPNDIWGQWDFSAAVVIPLLVAALLYGVGLSRAWSSAGWGKVISTTAASCYSFGILTLIIALMSPLDAVSDVLFSVHMVQHLLLILVASPLLVLGTPDMALLWALPKRWRGGFGRFCYRLGGSLSNEDGHSLIPLLLALLATGVLWVWHIPSLYDLALNNEAIHYSEHLSFLVTAILFWSTVLRLRPRDHRGNGLRILYVFGMAIQGSVLGALITLASRPLYQSHVDIPDIWRITPLTDQQLAGMIMWVPPALLYIAVIAYLFHRWLAQSEARPKYR